MDYISITKTAKKWGISARRIRALCKEEFPEHIKRMYIGLFQKMLKSLRMKE